MNRLVSGSAGLVLLAGLGLATAREVVEANPNKDYHVTPESGPWLICAASYTGPDAGLLARELVQVIRRDYLLPAYLLDKGKEERRQQQQDYMKQLENCPQGRFRGCRIREEFAVLVGGYNDMDAARNALDGIRKLKPPPAKFCTMYEHARAGKSKKGENGVWLETLSFSPFTTAFVVHNPTAGPIEKENETADPLLRKFNSGETYNLLNCSKGWTLVVKTFYGTMVVQPQSGGSKFLELIGWSGKQQLNASALQAHELAKLLRSQKPPFEAYVLHTRNSSIVTVGGYEGPNDSQLLLNQRTLAKMQLTDGNKDPSKRVVLMELLPQPMPMQVPRP